MSYPPFTFSPIGEAGRGKVRSIGCIWGRISLAMLRLKFVNESIFKAKDRSLENPL